ncbi:MAG: DUF4293 domain-containing protein [Chitinophagaceae bacterium]|jgi:DMSO/TMAO reductase YedYZ heme-binding membrane subunit|nr:DUF4293 domain-containing protein [Chitinophagaceae bacterium]
MIQRIQTLWLLLASVCGFATLRLPFYVGSTGTNPAESFTAMSGIFILILTIAAAIVALVDIFLYKNRPLQLKLGFAGLAASIVILVLYFMAIRQYDAGALTLYSVAAFAVPVFYVLAIRGIYKDEKLVKSLDRLR